MPRLLVKKFGGTSMGSSERIAVVADIVAAAHAEGDAMVVVVSAMSGETDRLVELAQRQSGAPEPRELDMLLATGEQASAALLAMALQCRDCDARSYNAVQVGIGTDASYNKARIRNIDQGLLQGDIEAGRVPVVAGFQGIAPNGDITTLGRGGSDLSAVALAAVLGASECQIFTDVDGVYTADPRMCEGARRIDKITFEEMLELAGAGAKVLQSRAVEFAARHRVRLRVLSSFAPDPGTLILHEDTEMETPLVSSISSTRDEAKLTIRGVPDQPGVAARILGPVADAGIEVDVIVQNVGADNTTDFTFTVARRDFKRGEQLLRDIAGDLNAGNVSAEDNIAKVSLIGIGMRSHSGIASRMFAALAAEAINIQMISTSEIKISVVVEEDSMERAVVALHRAFDQDLPGEL